MNIYKKIYNYGKKCIKLLGILVYSKKCSAAQNGPINYNICDMHFLDRIRPALDRVTSSHAGRWYTPYSYRIGWVTDDILYDAFKAAAPGILLEPGKWQDQIKNIDVFFFISCWTGMHGEWKGIAYKESEARQTVYEIIDACKRNNIPTIFYTCEDPPSYHQYIGIARRCDYIFTSAEEMIPSYKNDCGHDRIYSLLYGINPYFHNPVGIRSNVKSNDVLFAGSWYSQYEDRCHDTKILFDGVIQSGKNLKIIDRNLLQNESWCTFPERYHKYCSPPFSHDELQKVQKLYNWCLNLNSVKDSQTMFANRCFELLASGNLLISNYSVGVNSLLPLIFTSQSSDEIARILNTFTSEEVYERQIMGIRFAFNGNTCFDRVAQILNIIGLPVKADIRRVAVVTDGSDSVRNSFNRQTFPHKELLTADELRGRSSEFDIVAFFHPDAFYGEFYLEDMCNGFKYTDAVAITKDAWMEGKQLHRGVEHNFVDNIHDKHRTVFWRETFDMEFLLELEGELPCRAYSIDHFEYNAMQTPKAESLREYFLSVILPTYNNGIRLYGKAFASLRRSSMFEGMEIILVDDGSTDGLTPAIIRHLEHKYPNVRSFFFNDGGSGSAARPRNKGLDISTAAYVAFLDPDDEATEDGYATMYERAIHGNFDLVIGNMNLFTKYTSKFDFSERIKKTIGSDIIESGGKDILAALNFMPGAVQSLLVRKEFLEKKHLKFISGAVGEDKFFMWQLFINVKRALSTSITVFTYYAAIPSSTTDAIGKSFFRRSLRGEEVYSKWLCSNNLIHSFMEKRFTQFFSEWYLEKLAQVNPEELDECKRTLRKIFDLYADFYTDDDSTIKAFLEETAS